MCLSLLTSPRHLFIYYKIGLSMGKPTGRHSHTRYIFPNPKKDPKRGRDPMIVASSYALPSIGCQSPKMVKHDQEPSKLGQGPTCPQHSPMTRPESLWSDQLRFECLELGLSYFDLLQCNDLFLSELLDHCVIYWSCHALLCSDDNLFKLNCLALNFSE